MQPYLCKQMLQLCMLSIAGCQLPGMEIVPGEDCNAATSDASWVVDVEDVKA